MAEYIKREAALDICEKEYQERLRMLDYCGDTVAGNIGHAIKSLPTADVAPVVRCNDCVHYDLGVCLKIYSDGNAQKDSWQSRNPDDFCSYGERKEAE